MIYGILPKLPAKKDNKNVLEKIDISAILKYKKHFEKKKLSSVALVNF